MKDDVFNDPHSGSQFGTTAWAMNVLHCSNAKKGPHQAFNAYKDFSDKELNAQVIAATMTHFQMQSYDGELKYFCTLNEIDEIILLNILIN